MTEWYDFYGFEQNPYEIKEPMKIPYELIEWNRDDLKDKWQMQRFIEDILKGRSVSIRIFGPSGSGKTWLLRYIEKEIKIKRERADAVFLYTKLTRVGASFLTFYKMFISNFKQIFLSQQKRIAQEAGLKIEDWENYFGDSDLAKALYYIAREDKERNKDAERWLMGERVGSSVLSKLDIISSLDDYKKCEVIKNIIRKVTEWFSVCLFFVDEIALVTPSVGRALGGVLKELLDEFYEKFSLAITYTATASDALIDYGYDYHFYRRFDYEVELSPIPEEYISDFFRVHHKCYRKKQIKVTDELSPFTEKAIKELYNLIAPEYRHPGPILKAAGNIVREAYYSKKKEIEPKFVKENKERIPKESLSSS